MILLVLLTPAAVLGLFWAMQRMEIWMNRTTQPRRTTGRRQAGTSAPSATGVGRSVSV